MRGALIELEQDPVAWFLVGAELAPPSRSRYLFAVCPTRRNADLHRFRESLVGATYFATCCTAARQTLLTRPAIADQLLANAQRLDREGDTVTFGFVVMPDHCHWLFELGNRNSLSRTIAKFKSLTTPLLKKSDGSWQRDYYEHRLRGTEHVEDYLRYAFLNPYRAGLVTPAEPWPWWWSGRPEFGRFREHLDSKGCPPSEWIREPIPTTVRHGE